jgi:hypothetical protein
MRVVITIAMVMLLRDFGPYECCYTRCNGNVVNGPWALFGNVCDRVSTAMDFHITLDGQFTSLDIMK